MVLGVREHLRNHRDGIYIGEGRIPELLSVHLVGYEGILPSLKRLLIREVIYIGILSHFPLRSLSSCDLLDKECPYRGTLSLSYALETKVRNLIDGTTS